MVVFSVGTLYGEQQASQEQDVVLVADVDALIHPVSAEYIAQTLDRAADEDAELVVLMLKRQAASSIRLEKSTPILSNQKSLSWCMSAQVGRVRLRLDF